MSIYGMPPDDPSSFVPEDTIPADSRAEYEQDAETAYDDQPIDEGDEAGDSESPES